jgi:hypothetical protein
MIRQCNVIGRSAQRRPIISTRRRLPFAEEIAKGNLSSEQRIDRYRLHSGRYRLTRCKGNMLTIDQTIAGD